MKAFLKIGRRMNIEVSDLGAAADAYSRERDASGEGASTFPDGRVVADGAIYRISYNGRVWDRSGKPVVL
jgi:hypothetical protein